jgi:hypothetical protein
MPGIVIPGGPEVQIPVDPIFPTMPGIVMPDPSMPISNEPTIPTMPGIVIPGPGVELPLIRDFCQEPRPRMCTKEYRPVCGSNNRTYPNKCSACSDS